MEWTFNIHLIWEKPIEVIVTHGHRDLVIPLGPVRDQSLGEPFMPNASLTITDVQQFGLGPVTGVDARGNPVPLLQPVHFASNDETMLHVQDNGDNTAEALAMGPIGMAQITVSDGTLTAMVDVTIVPSLEVGFAIPLGAPTEQAPVVTP